MLEVSSANNGEPSRLLRRLILLLHPFAKDEIFLSDGK